MKRRSEAAVNRTWMVDEQTIAKRSLRSTTNVTIIDAFVYSCFYVCNNPARVLRGFFSNAAAYSFMGRWEQVPGQPNCPMDGAEIQRGVCASAHDVIKPLRMEFHEAALKFAEPRKREREAALYTGSCRCVPVDYHWRTTFLDQDHPRSIDFHSLRLVILSE